MEVRKTVNIIKQYKIIVCNKKNIKVIQNLICHNNWQSKIIIYLILSLVRYYCSIETNAGLFLTGSVGIHKKLSYMDYFRKFHGVKISGHKFIYNGKGI